MQELQCTLSGQNQGLISLMQLNSDWQSSPPYMYSHSAYLGQQQTYIVVRVSIQKDQRIVLKKQVNFFTSEKKITWTTEI